MFNLHIKPIILAVSSTVLFACGGSATDTGKQSDSAPIAKAEVFGASTQTSDLVQVRSGKEVLLSGVNSSGVDDPLLSYEWVQIDNSGFNVELYERTRNTIAFTAPQVSLSNEEGVELQFQLQVVDGDGKTATDVITVQVKPAYDADQFLLNPRVEEQYVLIVAANEGELLPSDLSFDVQLTKTAVWQDRAGNINALELGRDTYSGIVSEGTAPALIDRSNKYFKLPIPLLDADDINVNYQGESRSGRLEFEHVDTATLNLDYELIALGSSNITMYLARETDTGFELLDEAGIARDTNTLSINEEWLRQQVGVESRRSSNNYYDCIDPEGNAETLADWIEYAGFNGDEGIAYHTSYVNNYDLNFGRDMYVRRDGNGNVYTYVTNYPSLENLFTGRNEFAIVVMEYSAAPTGNCGDGTFADDVIGKKIVKFYSYVPDEVTGEYVRAVSMNFDGRGERFVPGVCVACHYGDTNADQFNAENLSDISASAADLDSSFIPWDLDAFLFTGGDDIDLVDPVYNPDNLAEFITTNYSREAQENSFRAQNQIVLDTFTHELDNLKRFEVPIKLLHGWYGNGDLVEALDFGTEESPLSEEDAIALKAQVQTLPGNTFDGDYVQLGWRGQEALYHDVYSRNCRLCHAQVANQTINFDTYEEFITNERVIPYIYEQGLMPLSRLTMDRFWIDFYGEDSPAEILRDHLNSDNDPNNDVPINQLPGFPVAQVTPGANESLTADVSIDFDETILFDANDSLFANAYEWNINGSFVGDKEKYLFQATTPGETHSLTMVAINTEEALVSRTLERRIVITNNAPNAQGIASPSVNEGESVSINVFESLCPGLSPDDASCRAVFGDIQETEVPTLSISGSVTNGNAVVSDVSNGIIEFTSTVSSAFGDGEFSIVLEDSFGEESEVASVSVTINALDGPAIVGPDICNVDAINHTNESSYPIAFGLTPCLDPSVNDTVSGGLSLTVSEVGVPTQTDAEVSVDGLGVISYTPPRFYIGGDSFSYTVQDNSLSARTNRGTVAVTITPTITYTDLSTGSGVFATSAPSEGCGECHDGNTVGAPNWFVYDNVVLAATNTNVIPYGVAEIELQEPTSREAILSSILFQNACDAIGGHPGGNRLCTSAGSPNDAGDLNAFGQALLQWIEEGANNN
ncbi:MAG: hypothetical protein K6L76_12255 [Agarilytica sp.]